MNKYIGKFKVSRTMYFEFYYGDDYYYKFYKKDKPKYEKYMKDYDLIRKGEVFKAIYVKDNPYYKKMGYSVICVNDKKTIYFKELHELLKCSWLDIISDFYEE